MHLAFIFMIVHCVPMLNALKFYLN